MQQIGISKNKTQVSGLLVYKWSMIDEITIEIAHQRFRKIHFWFLFYETVRQWSNLHLMNSMKINFPPLKMRRCRKIDKINQTKQLEIGLVKNAFCETEKHQRIFHWAMLENRCGDDDDGDRVWCVCFISFNLWNVDVWRCQQNSSENTV